MRTFHIGARLRVVLPLAIAAAVGGGAYAAVAASRRWRPPLLYRT